MIVPRGARGDANAKRTHSEMSARLAASPARLPKPKKYPYNHFFGGGVWGGADRKRKGYFFVLGSPQ